jgi:hypothetical protein
MNVRSRQYSGLSSNSAMASACLPHRLDHDDGPAHTSCAMVLSDEIVNVDAEVSVSKGFILSVKYDKAKN